MPRPKGQIDICYRKIEPVDDGRDAPSDPATHWRSASRESATSLGPISLAKVLRSKALFLVSAFAQRHRESFHICRTEVLNTPCGQIVRHIWWKDLFQELVEDEFKATVAKLCFGVSADPTVSPPLDLQALLDP